MGVGPCTRCASSVCVTNVKRMIEKLAGAREWVCAGQGFEAKESAVRLSRSSAQQSRREFASAVSTTRTDGAGTCAKSATSEAKENTQGRHYVNRRRKVGHDRRPKVVQT